MNIVPEDLTIWSWHARNSVWDLPTITSLPLELERQGRENGWRGGGARFPDYGNIFGDSTNHMGWQNNGTAREAQNAWSPFTVPYRGPAAITTPINAPPQRVGIDGPAVDPSKVIGMFPALEIDHE